MASLAKCKGEFCGEKVGILFTQFQGVLEKRKIECHGKGRGQSAWRRGQSEVSSLSVISSEALLMRGAHPLFSPSHPLTLSPSIFSPSIFSPFPYLNISNGDARAFFLALASRVYLATVQARCSGGSVPLSRLSMNASRTR